MTEKQNRLRIRGLVRLMNEVRDQLRTGVPPGEAEAFRTRVEEAIVTVDRLCREHHTRPSGLPAPSRRAYAYLRSLDLDHLPAPSHVAEPAAQRIQIPGIIATCDRYHREFSTLLSETVNSHRAAPGVGLMPKQKLEELLGRLAADADAIASICEEEGSVPAMLPVRSRRGYQWLRFLSQGEHLRRHLATLAFLQRTVRQAPNAVLPARRTKGETPVHIEIYATSSLFRAQAKGSTLYVVLNEGFIGAPESLLESLMRAALTPEDETARNAAKRYATSSAFADIQAALQATTPHRYEAAAQGVHHDLRAAFDRVNARYFGDQLTPPILTWSRQRTYRKLGHYEITRNTIMVSITLDDPRVPDYVIDYVIYHELLHRELGVSLKDGRQQAHTPEFRTAEQHFADYHEAQRFVARMMKGDHYGAG